MAILELLALVLDHTKDALAGFRKARHRRAMRNAKASVQAARAGYGNQYLAPYLEWKYPHIQLLHGAGHTFPVAVFPVSKSQSLQVDSVLGEFRRIRRREFTCSSDSYRRTASVLGLSHENRPCYAMRSLRSGATTTVECDLGTYFDALDTCDELAWEILRAQTSLLASSDAHFRRFDAKLTKRAALHSRVADPVSDGTNRCAALAGSVLLAYYDAGRLKLFLKRRGSTVAIHQGMLHVIPSFMVQPVTADSEYEYSVRHNFEREYLEELFGREDPQVQGDWQYFYSDPALTSLRSLLQSGGAVLRLTGVVVNLLNLRPEVCAVLLIKDPAWLDLHRKSLNLDLRFRFNWEWESLTAPGTDIARTIASIDYVDDEREMLRRAGVRPHEFVPPGAAAFFLGIRTLKDMI